MVEQKKPINNKTEIEGIGAKRVEENKRELVDLRKSLNNLGDRAKHLQDELKSLEDELNTIDAVNDKETEEVKTRLANLEAKIVAFRKKIKEAEKILEIQEANANLLKVVEDSIAFVKKRAEMLTGKPAEHLKWIVKTVEDALAKKDENGQIEVMDNETGNKQKEGIPVDDLIDALQNISDSYKTKIAELEAIVKHSVAQQKAKLLEWYNAKADFDINKDEHQHKMAWNEVYKSLPKNNPLRAAVDNLRRSWAEMDRKKESFTVGGREFIIGQKVKYTNEKGETREYTVVDKTQEKTPGLILKSKTKASEFVIPAESLPRVEIIPGSIDYDKNTDQFALQTGEALRQIIETKIKELDNIKATVDNLNKSIETLTKNSKKYSELHPDVNWRIRLEAKLISSDHRSTGSEEGNYEEAKKTMSRRRELVLKPISESALVGEEIKPVVTENRGRIVEDEGELPPPEPEELEENEEEDDGGELSESTSDDIRPPEIPAFLIDVSAVVRALAMRQAEEKLNAILRRGTALQTPSEKPAEEGGWFKKMGRKIFDFGKRTFVRLSERAYLRKFYEEALREIKNNKNLMAEIETSIIKKSKGKAITSVEEDRNIKILDEVITTFVQEVAEAEEKGEKINDPDVNSALAALFYQFATGAISGRKEFDTLVIEKVVPIIRSKGYKFSMDKKRQSKEAEGLMYANNFFEMAKAYKNYIKKLKDKLTKEYGAENEAAIERHIKGLIALEVQLGLKEKDIRETKPEKVLTWFEKLVDNAQNIPVLGKILASPTAVGAGSAAFATLAIRRGVSASLRAFMAAPVVGALFGGVLGAMRRGRDLQYDRGMELRRQALGQKAGGARAEKIRQFSYEIVSLDEVLPQLEMLLLKNSAEELTSSERLLIADMYARLTVERKLGIDLFSAQVKEGQELKTNIGSINKLKIALKNIRAKFNLGPEQLSSEISKQAELYIDDAAKKDREFNNFRRLEMIKAGVFGAVAGLTVGAGMESIITGIQGKFAESSVAHLWEYISGNHHPEFSPSIHMQEVLVPGTNNTIKIPDNVIMARSGNMLVFSPQGHPDEIIGTVQINPDNSLDMSMINKSGWVTSVIDHHIAGEFFSSNLHEVPIDGIPGAIFKLPEGMDLIRNIDGTYSIVNQTMGREVINGLNFTPNGRLTAESSQLLKDMGWNINEGIAKVPETTRDHDTILKILREKYGNGRDGEEWRRLWHGNIDTRLPLTDQHTSPFNTDLMAHTQKTGHWPYEVPNPAGGPPTKGTIFDWREIIGNFRFDKKTGDATLGVRYLLQDILRHGASNGLGIEDDKFNLISHWINAQRGDWSRLTERFSVRFYLSDADYEAGRGISLPVDANGNIHLPKGSELYNILIDATRGKVKLTIETCYDDPATRVHHIFSTFRTHGEFDGPLTFLKEQPLTELTHDVILGTDNSEYTFIPPPIEDNPWFLPFPFNPRRPLEKGMFPNLEYNYTSSAITQERQQIFEQMRSQTLKENPRAKLDHYVEAEMYINNWEKDYRAQIETLVNQIGPMSPETRIVACIPVAGHQEGKNIYKSLENYVGQTLDKKQFELVLFVNHPQIDKDGKPVKPDETLEEIERFKRDYPDVQVKVMYSALPPEQANIGFIRKALNDAVLLRQHARGKNAPDLIMVSNDADNLGVSPKYFEAFLKKFDENEDLDGVLGELDWDPEAYAQYPDIYVGTAIFQRLDEFRRKTTGRVGYSGANFAFRSSIYAGIGGYIPGTQCGEDVLMGQAIIAARQDHRVFGYSYDSLLFTSARRSIDAWKKGLSPIEQWHRGFSAFDDLRKETLGKGEIIDYDNPDVLNKLKQSLEYVINRTLDVYEQGEGVGKDSDFYHRALGNLGIDYRVNQDNRIEITNMTPFVRNIKEFQHIAVAYRDFYSGKPGNLEKMKQVSEALREADKKKREETLRRYDSEMTSFLTTEKFTPPEISSIPSYEEVSARPTVSKFGDIVVTDMLLGENENVAIGYNPIEKKVYIVKTTNEETVDWFREFPQELSQAKALGYSEHEIRDIEDFLIAKKVGQINISLPVDKKRVDGKVISAYEAGKTDLWEYIKSKGKISPKEALSIIIRLCNSIKTLHDANVVHTDISPSNIILTQDGVKLIDLDSGAIGNTTFIRNAIRGNRFIMPPEMFNIGYRGKIRFNKNADIYEASVVLYRLVTGKWPHVDKDDAKLTRKQKIKRYGELHAKEPIKYPDYLPQSLKNVLARGMHPQPEQRYQNIEEFALDLIKVYKEL